MRLSNPGKRDLADSTSSQLYYACYLACIVYIDGGNFIICYLPNQKLNYYV
jgi:hypothetical protein